MTILINIVLSALAVFAADYVLTGVAIAGFWTALVVAIVLGVINAFVRPIVLVLTLPINVFTLGLFTFVINALMVLLGAAIVPGFTVDGFWWALLFSLVVSLIRMAFGSLARPQVAR